MVPLPIPLTVVLVAVLAATITDLRAFRIYNYLTFPLLISGLIYRWSTGGTDGLTNGVYGAGFGFVSLLPLFLLGGMGGGDVKLMAGVGAWLGWPFTFLVFVVAAFATGVYSVYLMLSGGRARETWVRLQIVWHRIASFGKSLGAEDQIEAEVHRPDRRQRLVPFAAMTMIGLIVVTVWFRLRLGETALAACP